MKRLDFNHSETKERILILTTSFILIFLSIISLSLNYFFFEYQGNNYFPPGFWGIGLILILIVCGLFLLLGKNNYPFQVGKEFIYFFLIYSIIALATNAAQLTPFKPIDNLLISIDAYFHIHLGQLMAKTAAYPFLRILFELAYLSLAYQMVYLPIILIFMGRFTYLREYYCLLLLTAVIGFSLYYFFPTMGPSSFIKSPFFTEEQYATGIKFTEIHQLKTPSTAEGGLVAMPSFHAIWAVLCILLTRSIPILFFLTFIINCLLIFSCVLLGWHYFIDLFVAGVILSLAYYLYFYYTKSSTYFSNDTRRIF